MHWGILDYVAAAAIIGIAVLAIRLSFRLARREWLRWVLAVLVLLAAALVWAELAVGIFD